MGAVIIGDRCNIVQGAIVSSGGTTNIITARGDVAKGAAKIPRYGRIPAQHQDSYAPFGPHFHSYIRMRHGRHVLVAFLLRFQFGSTAARPARHGSDFVHGLATPACTKARIGVFTRIERRAGWQPPAVLQQQHVGCGGITPHSTSVYVWNIQSNKRGAKFLGTFAPPFQGVVRTQ